MSRAKAVLACLWAAGCATGEAGLTRDEIERMPRDARVAIYDGENDVVIAKSRRDEALLRRAALRREISELGDRADRTATRLKKAKLGDRVGAVKKAVSVHRDYLEAELTAVAAAVDATEEEVGASRARLELTRQRQLVRTGRVLASTVEAYEQHVKDLEKKTKEAQRKELDLRTSAQKVFEKWKAAEDAYARATGDWDSGIWID